MRLIPVLILLLSGTGHAADPTPKQLIQAFQGCYRASFHFREGAPGKDSTDRVKEWLTQEEADDVITIRHKTLIDADAEGDDSMTVGWLRRHAEAKRTGGAAVAPVVFEHLRETWERVRGTTWKQTTYGPAAFGGRKLMECSGDFAANAWSCDVTEPVGMLRRDRQKGRRDFQDMLISQRIFFASPDAPRPYVSVTQRNRKRDARQEVVSVEHGWIEYTKLDAEQCRAARN